MKRSIGVLASAAIDRHGEQFADSALKMMVDQVNSRWIPVGIEHDPRIPPVGRVVAARLVRRAGEAVVEGEIETFEQGDVIPLSVDRNEPDIDRYNPGEFGVRCDRGYKAPADRAEVDELAKLLGTRVIEEHKKSLEPITVLTIAGGFVLSQLAGGFLQELGSDAYDAVKAKLKSLFSRPKPNGQERLLVFRVAFEKNGVAATADVILSDPSPDDIDGFLSEGVSQLAASLDRYFAAEHGMRELTYEYRDRELQLRFAVRRDAVPLFPKAVPPVRP